MMTNTDELARRIIQRALSATDTTPTLTIDGQRYTASDLEAITPETRLQMFGVWKAEYIKRFLIAASDKLQYPVIYDPDGEPVDIEARIPGKTIIRVVYTRANSTDAS